MDIEKKCARCHSIKSSSEFGLLQSAPGGLNRVCKACRRDISRKSQLRLKNGKGRKHKLFTSTSLLDLNINRLKQNPGFPKIIMKIEAQRDRWCLNRSSIDEFTLDLMKNDDLIERWSFCEAPHNNISQLAQLLTDRDLIVCEPIKRFSLPS